MIYERIGTKATLARDRRMSALVGAEAGVVSGAVMLLAWMIYTAATGEGFFFPAKEIAATFLGVEAIIGGAGAVILGATIHFVVAAAWGAGFGLLIPPNSDATSATGWGLAYGVGTWLVMTFVVAPIFDPVLSDRISLYTGWWFVFHLLYGAVLGVAPEIARRMSARGAPAETYRRAA